MSQTFRHKGRRVDFDLWMYPDLSLDLDFDLLASLVIGTHVSNVFENQSSMISESFEEIEFTEVTRSLQFAIGAAAVAAGVAIVTPGPVMLAVGYYLGPVGVAVYVALGVVLIIGGSILMWTA